MAKAMAFEIWVLDAMLKHEEPKDNIYTGQIDAKEEQICCWKLIYEGC
jgi:hypothetical protein